METEVLLGILIFAGGLIGTLAGWLGRTLRPPKPINGPNPHPNNVRTGDLAAQYWLAQFGQIHTALGEIKDVLARIDERLSHTVQD